MIGIVIGLGLVDILQGELIFLLDCLLPLLSIVKVGYLDGGLLAFGGSLLKGQSVLFVVLDEVDTDLGQRTFGVLQTKAGLDGVITIPLMTIAFATVFN